MKHLKNEIKGLLAPLKETSFKPAFIILSACLLFILTKQYGSAIFFRKTIAPLLNLDISRPELIFLSKEYRLLIRPVLQFLIPLLFIIYPLKMKIGDFGTKLGDWRKGLFWTSISCAVMTAIIVPISQNPAFAKYYGNIPMIADSWVYFGVFASSYFFYMIGWEFIGRGYMLFGLEKEWGTTGAIFVQAIPFVMLHIGKPIPETLASIIASVFLGLLALRTRSFWWGVFLHTYAIVLMYFIVLVSK